MTAQTARTHQSANSYQAQQLNDIKTQVNVLATSQQTMALTVGRIEDQLKGINPDIESKVSREMYEGAMARVNDRLMRLEGGTQKLLSWLALGLSGCSVLLIALGMAGGAVIYIVTHP